MKPRYLLIESHDPFEQRYVGEDYELARGLAAHGSEVTVFLVQNGVLPARRGARREGFDRLLESEARVVADRFSLGERAIPAGALQSGVGTAELDIVIDALAQGDKVVWL